MNCSGTATARLVPCRQVVFGWLPPSRQILFGIASVMRLNDEGRKSCLRGNLIRLGTVKEAGDP